MKKPVRFNSSFLRALFSRLARPFQTEKGSALLMVLVFAGVLLALAPIYARMINQSAQQNAQNRAAMGKRLIMQNVESMLMSPAALSASLRLASFAPGTDPDPPMQNGCLKVCLEGVSAPEDEDGCADIDISPASYSANTIRYCHSYYRIGASAVTPMWHPFSLYSPAELIYTAGVPTSGTVIAGIPRGQDYPVQATEANIPGVLYNYDGTICQLGAAFCPVEVLAFFHPVCSGDSLLDATPSVATHGLTPLPFPMICNQAVAVQVAYLIRSNAAYTGKRIAAYADYDSRRDPLNRTQLRPLNELPIVPLFPNRGGAVLAQTAEAPYPRYLRMGGRRGCATLSDRSVHCWGENTYNQGAFGSTTSSLPKVVENAGGIRFLLSQTYLPNALSLSTNHSCIILSNGRVNCWGLNDYGQVGDGTIVNRDFPTWSFSSISGKEVSVGTRHSCAITTANVIYCWGRNVDSALGSGLAGGNYPTHQAVVGYPAGTYDSLCSGFDYNCARNAGTNQVYCWGKGSQGQLGNGANANSNGAVAVNQAAIAPAFPVKVACGQSTACLLTNTNRVYCWGTNTDTALGTGPGLDTNQPANPVLNPNVLDGPITDATDLISSDNNRLFCALRSAGHWTCWGRNGGAFANGATANPDPSTHYASSAIGLSQVRAGWDTNMVSCALSSSTALVRCSGSTTFGQFGTGALVSVPAPTTELQSPAGPWDY